jgi:hypothetical protein
MSGLGFALNNNGTFAIAYVINPETFTVGYVQTLGTTEPDAAAPTVSILADINTINEVDVYRFDVFDLPFQTHYPTITFDIDIASRTGLDTQIQLIFTLTCFPAVKSEGTCKLRQSPNPPHGRCCFSASRASASSRIAANQSQH